MFRPPRTLSPSGLAYRDVMEAGVLAWVVRRTPQDDVASVRVDLAEAVVAIAASGLPDAELEDALARLDWRLRDRRAGP